MKGPQICIQMCQICQKVFPFNLILPLLNQVSQMRTTSHLQWQPLEPRDNKKHQTTRINTPFSLSTVLYVSFSLLLMDTRTNSCYWLMNEMILNVKAFQAFIITGYSMLIRMISYIHHCFKVIKLSLNQDSDHNKHQVLYMPNKTRWTWDANRAWKVGDASVMSQLGQETENVQE